MSVVPTSRRKPPKPTVVCFVRHGTTATTGKVLPGRVRGLHLSEQGRGEAARAAEGFKGLKVAAVYASPLERTRETAEPISRVVGKPVVVERGLVECDFGSWTGESFLELQSRLTDTVEKICRAHPGEIVVAVSHADCIKTALASALGVPLDLFQRIGVAPCSISTVVYGSDGPLVQTMGATYGSAGVSPSPGAPR